MQRERVDALDERVQEIRASVDGLREENASVREQCQTLEIVLTDAYSSDTSGVQSEYNGSSLAGSTTDSTEEITNTRHSRAEASDEDVAAAIQAVETDGGTSEGENESRKESDEDENSDDIIVC